jgi:type III secretion protein T
VNAELAQAFFEFVYPLLSALGLAVARSLGLVIITPAFNRLGLSGMLRSAVAVVISIPVLPEVSNALAGMEPPGALGYAGLLIKEMIIGLIIGLFFGIPFWAAELAGELIDLQRGSTMAQLLDPLSIGESSVMSTYLTVVLIALFFMSGGFLVMLDGLYQSYHLWPAQGAMPILSQQSALQILHMLDRIMYIGVMMVAPLVIALLVADVLLAYLSRMAPQLHVFDLSLPIKNMLFAVLLTLYAAFLLPYMFSQLGDLRQAFQQATDLMSR